MRVDYKIPLLVAVLGLGSIPAVKSGWTNYICERWRYGGAVSVSGQCLALPFGWTSFPGERSEVHDVHRHFAGVGSEVFASVLPMTLVSSLRNSESLPIASANGFVLYDLGPTSPGGPIRYIALNESKAIALMAARDDLMRELAVKLLSCK